ncbi:hypothetical protein [Cryptosporangium minutisporangium]|uniref:Uncharacterized protein n=1 Tax=Cryptosporangium minutisporangium TaxID=113569 RepID=A0ABP6T395_9ACTN
MNKRLLFAVLGSLGVIVVCACAANSAAIGYLFQTRPNSYEDNLDAARRLGVPPGFTRTAEVKLDSDRVRVTYVACPNTCRADAISLHGGQVRQWLRAIPNVVSVGDPESAECTTPTDCTIPIRTEGSPTLSDARLTLAPRGDLEFRLVVG